MLSALAIEQGLVLGKGKQSAVEPEGTPNLLYPIGDNRNPAELEFWHIQELLAKENSLEMIAKRAWSQEGNLLDLLQTGIIGLFAWEYSPLVWAGETLQLGLAKLKTLERGISLDDALEMPISESSPDLFKGLSGLLSAAVAASVLPVPANLLGQAKKDASVGPQQSGEHPQQTPPEGWGGWQQAAISLVSFLLASCFQRFQTPRSPGVTIATNTPDQSPSATPTEKPGATHMATMASTLTETQTGGAGGAEVPGGPPGEIKSLLESGKSLPITDCVTTPETGGNREEWDNWIKTLVDNGAKQTEIDELKATITTKLKSQGINYSTTLELCSGGGGGWSFAVRDKSSGLFWLSYDLKNNRFADRPDRVLDNDRDWQFRPMPREGLKSELRVKVMMINGWPQVVAVNPEDTPIQYFVPVLGESINFYPDPDTATPAPSNTPRPTEIPATRRAPEPNPTIPPEPSPTTLPALPCDQRGGPENECLTHICFVSDYVNNAGNFTPKGTNSWAVDWYARQVLDSGAAVIGDCP